MNYKRVFVLFLLCFVLFLGLRAYFLFNQNPAIPNARLLETIAISKTTPYDIQNNPEEVNFLNNYTYAPETALLTVYVFSDTYCMGFLNLPRETYPYKLFFKLHQLQPLTRVMSICPEEFTTDDLLKILNEQPKDLGAGKKYAILSLGYYDTIRALGPQLQPQLRLQTPSSFKQIMASDDFSTIQDYLWRKISSRTPLWEEGADNIAKVIDQFYQITEAYIASYSSASNSFSIDTHTLAKQVSSLKNLPPPLAKTWEKFLDKTNSNNSAPLDLLISVNALYSLQTPGSAHFENLLLKISETKPELFKNSKSLNEALLHYLVNSEESKARSLISKLNPLLKTLNDPFLTELFWKDANFFETAKAKAKNKKRENLVKIIKLLQSKQIIPIVMTYPFDLPLFANDDLRTVAKENQVNLLDLPMAIRERGNIDSSLQTLGGHLNSQGSELAAQIIFQRILEMNVQ